MLLRHIVRAYTFLAMHSLIGDVYCSNDPNNNVKIIAFDCLKRHDNTMCVCVCWVYVREWVGICIYWHWMTREWIARDCSQIIEWITALLRETTEWFEKQWTQTASVRVHFVEFGNPKRARESTPTFFGGFLTDSLPFVEYVTPTFRPLSGAWTRSLPQYYIWVVFDL